MKPFRSFLYASYMLITFQAMLLWGIPRGTRAQSASTAPRSTVTAWAIHIITTGAPSTGLDNIVLVRGVFFKYEKFYGTPVHF